MATLDLILRPSTSNTVGVTYTKYIKDLTTGKSQNELNDQYGESISGIMNSISSLNLEGLASLEYVNNAINEAIENIPSQDLNGLATEEYVSEALKEALENIPLVDFSGLATEEYVSEALKEALENIPSTDLSTIEKNIEILSGAIVENEKIVTKALQTIEEEIEGISNVDLSGLATETFVEDAISGAIAEIPSVDLSGLATEESVNVLSGIVAQIKSCDCSGHVDLSGYATEAFVSDAIAAIPSVDLSGLATEEYVNVLSGAIVDNEKVVSKAINDTQESVNILSGIVAALPKVDINGNVDLSGYATEAFVSDAIKDNVKWDVRGDRKHIVLPNHMNIIGNSKEGGEYNLMMLSKWDVADFGSSSIHMNLNSLSGKVTLNDNETIATETFVNDAIANITLPSVDLSGLATEESVNVLSGIVAQIKSCDCSGHVDLSGYATEAFVSDATKDNVKWDVRGDRKHIVLPNHMNIIGNSKEGGEYNLMMLSKWDVADFGSSSIHMNLNSLSGKVTLNDNETIATETFVNDAISGAIASLPQGGGEVDLSGYATEKYVLDNIDYIELEVLPQYMKSSKLSQYLSDNKYITSGQLAQALESVTPSGYVLQSEYDEMVNTFSGLISTLMEDMKTIKENAITIA